MSSYKVLSLPGSDLKIDPYLGFIISNWMTTLRFTNELYKLIDEAAYYAIYPKVIHALLNKPDCTVNLAISTEDEDLCYGFCVYQGATVHYWFVKRDGRKQKIGTALLPKKLSTVTHLTIPGAVIWKRKFPHVIFNPFFV